jgi:hypothetical protein
VDARALVHLAQQRAVEWNRRDHETQPLLRTDDLNTPLRRQRRHRADDEVRRLDAHVRGRANEPARRGCVAAVERRLQRSVGRQRRRLPERGIEILPVRDDRGSQA